MCTQTTSPKVIQAGVVSPRRLVSWNCCVILHSKATGLSATRGGLTTFDGRASSPPSMNSSIASDTWAEVAFMASARGSVAMFHTNSPVSWMLRAVSFRLSEAKPMIGG